MAAGASLALVGAIAASQSNLWAPPGMCRQCECAVYDEDDAGTRLLRSVVLSFGGTYLAPDAGQEALLDRACVSQARAECAVPVGELVVDQVPAVVACFKASREDCNAGGLSRSIVCRTCAPAKACAQTEPVKVVPRTASDFNCGCVPLRFDAGGLCREPVPFADAGPYYQTSPAQTTLTQERALGAGCLRGLPCVEYGELQGSLGQGYPIPEACRPWPGIDASLPDAGPDTGLVHS